MPLFAPEQLAQWTDGRWTSPPTGPLTSFSFDTRRLRAGDAFVALKTDKRDGHDFLNAAQDAGASAALVASANDAISLPQLIVRDPLAALQTIAREHRQTFRRPVVGISGSAGKTSTKDLLSLLLGGASSGVDPTEDQLNRSAAASPFTGRVLATEGNLNNHIGVPLTLTRIDPAQHEFAVIEAGISAPGEMAALAGMIEPDLTIITLVAPAHTEELGGVAGVAREKSILAATTRAAGVAIFPQSVAEFPAFRELTVPVVVVERVEVLRSGEPSKNRVYYSVAQRAESTSIKLASRGRSREYFFRRVSDGMAQNAALALIAARWLGVPGETLQRRLAAWKPAKLRGEIRWQDGRLLYLDCYNANPASMSDALATFESIAPPGKPRLYVIGGMEELGAGAAEYHQELGRSLRLREGDRLLVIGTHAHEVCAGVLQRGDFTRQIQMLSSLEPAATAFSGWQGSVFVKGSRRYQLEKILEGQTSLPLPC